MATDAFTSTGGLSGVATAAALTNLVEGDAKMTPRGFRIRVTHAGITISKAASFGASQSAVSFPISILDARDLAQALIGMVG